MPDRIVKGSLCACSPALCSRLPWRASLLTECLQSWLFGQSGTAKGPFLVPGCVVERENEIIRMSHNVKLTHQVSFLSDDSFWELFVLLLFWRRMYTPSYMSSAVSCLGGGLEWLWQDIDWSLQH